MVKISVVTVCFNEPNLERTCRSVINQTCKDFEWIVIDGGSDFKTQEIWNRYKSKIDKFISEPDSGIYNAMNKGIKLANGEYLLFLNAGDFLYEEKSLENCVYNLDKDIVSANCNIIAQTNSLMQSPQNITSDFLIKSTIPHPATFIKKNLFDKYGLYDESYKIVSDWEKWIVFLDKNHCSYKHINVTVSNFTTDGISSTNAELCAKERNEVLSKYYSNEQIKLAFKEEKLTFLQMIFSIKNSKDTKHKIITIFGVHIKIKRRIK